MFKVQCRSNLDMFNNEKWPESLPALPNIGDRINSARTYGDIGYVVQLEVVSITWKQGIEKFYDRRTEDWDESKNKAYWYPEIELHLPKGRFETLLKFYEWYESISGYSKRLYI